MEKRRTLLVLGLIFLSLIPLFGLAQEGCGAQNNPCQIGAAPAAAPAPGATTPAPAAENKVWVKLGGGQPVEVTPATKTKLESDCKADPSTCQITGESQYTKKVDSDSITVSVNPSGTIEKGPKEVKISATTGGGGPLTFSANQAEVLIPTGATVEYVSATQFKVKQGDKTQDITLRGGYVEVKEKDTLIKYVVGNSPAVKQKDGSWEFKGETFATATPSADNSQLTLTKGNKDTFVIKQGTKGEVIQEEKSGETTTIKSTFPDGKYVEEEKEDGKTKERIGYDKEDGKKLWEDTFESGTLKSRKFFDEEGNLVGWCTSDCDKKTELKDADFSFKSEVKGCQPDNPACYQCGTKDCDANNKPPKEYQEAVHDEKLWKGKLDWQETAQIIFGHSISAYPLANHWQGYADWIEGVDEFFAEYYLGEEYWTSAICKQWWDVGPQEGMALIETPYGYQVAGHIEAEKTPVDQLLCDAEGKCPGELECKKNLCYKAGEKEPASGYLYKISWGVTAPSDAKFISSYAGGGAELTFNLQVYGDKTAYLFSEGGFASSNTLKLKPGESSKSQFPSMIVEYSPYNFNKVCVKWGDNPPQTLSSGFPREMEDLDDICEDPIPIATLTGKEGEAGAGAYGGAEEAGVKYCGLSGC